MRSQPAFAAPRPQRADWLPPSLVLAAMGFNLILCFLNGRFLPVSNLHVMAGEALILATALLAAYGTMRQEHLLLLSGTVVFALGLASLRVALGTEPSLNIKIVRDLAIPIVFFLVGLRVADIGRADRLVTLVAGLVLALALFEYFAVDVFTDYFNVARYYVARGTMDAQEALKAGDLFISGVRPAGAQGGRNLLPFLGDHRVSSVFLEPVSMGNFGLIVFTWGLVRSKFEGKLFLGVMGAGLACVVLSDSRFGAYFCLMSLVVVLLPAALARLAVALAPLAAIGVLLAVPYVVTGSYDPQHRYVDNGFVGRLVLSGQILAEFDWRNWLGLAPLPLSTFDSGYAYVLEGIGAVGVAAGWLVFQSLRGASTQFDTFRNVAAMYYAVLLSVSNSPFTIKTASLLWFLLGVLSRDPGRPKVPAPAPAPTPMLRTAKLRAARRLALR
ncbi:MAG TPA: hypothetical protein VFQ27_11750 [Xanthobacteraceae bacterium]|nr:hypothetical protein [Xanthobacteraceae bacterium]